VPLQALRYVIAFSYMEKRVPTKEAATMWTVVYLAKNKKIADRISELMSREGVLVKLQPVSKNTGDEDSYFEILVLESEVEEAHNILYELGY
jgi:hypothetical protein